MVRRPVLFSLAGVALLGVVAALVVLGQDRPEFTTRSSRAWVSASIGVSWTRRGAVGAEGLLREADMAMYRAKEHGRGAVALFDDLDRDPPWLDRAKVEHGAKVFRRYGVDVFKFAGAITLEGYSEASVAKPLALTGAYAGTSTRHRFLETAAFWIAVSEPAGLERGAAGRASAVRVRVMHVFVRRRLLSHPCSCRRWAIARPSPTSRR